MKILKILILEESDLNPEGLRSFSKFKSSTTLKRYEADFIIDKTYNPPKITKYSSTEAEKEDVFISLKKT